MEPCLHCGLPVLDRYYLSTADGVFHERCLRCAECDRPLHRERSCFRRAQRVYCAEDYRRRFRPVGAVCAGCAQPVQPGQLVQRLGLHLELFHVACFRCARCDLPLRRGQLIRLTGGRGRPECAEHPTDGGQLVGLSGESGASRLDFGRLLVSNDTRVQYVERRFPAH